MLEHKFAELFISQVMELIVNDADRETLFLCLQDYQSSHDLNNLLCKLQVLLNEPNKLELYDHMRPIIMLQHQIEYSLRIPIIPARKLRTVHLYNNPSQSLGFAIRGGFEHGVGIFVTKVQSGSQAHRQGLRVGDEVVTINSFTITEAIHEDVLNLIKSRDEIILKVTYIGMVPVKEDFNGQVTWHFVEDQVKKQTHQNIKIFIDTTGHDSIGCSILSENGTAVRFPGIFIEKVKNGSIADQIGLEPGDQIMEVNEISFRNITWEKAVLTLRSSRQLNIVIKKKAGSQFIQSLSTESNEGYTNVSVDALMPALNTASFSDDGPVYSTVNKINYKEASERRTSKFNEQENIKELDIIEQQLNRAPFTYSKLSSDTKINTIDLPGMSPNRSHSSNLSRMSTEAEIHIPTLYPDLANKSNSSAIDVADTEKPFYPQVPALGGAAAMLAERRLYNTSNTAPSLLGPAEEYQWTDNVPSSIYKQFSSNILDGRRLVSLTYNKNVDLGVDIEGGLGSPVGGKILVAVLLDGGIAHKSGKVQVGDQLLMINGHMLLGVTATEAERIILAAVATARDKVEVIYCETTLVNDETSSTYF